MSAKAAKAARRAQKAADSLLLDCGCPIAVVAASGLHEDRCPASYDQHLNDLMHADLAEHGGS